MVEVTFQTEKGEVKKYTVEKLLMATGRGPNSSNVGLEKIGVTMERGFVNVNEYLETSVKGVYAIGDVTPSPLLAHVAQQEGIVAAESIAGVSHISSDIRSVPGSFSKAGSTSTRSTAGRMPSRRRRCRQASSFMGPTPVRPKLKATTGRLSGAVIPSNRRG